MLQVRLSRALELPPSKVSSEGRGIVSIVVMGPKLTYLEVPAGRTKLVTR
jgi:hypothetical protein